MLKCVQQGDSVWQKRTDALENHVVHHKLRKVSARVKYAQMCSTRWFSVKRNTSNHAIITDCGKLAQESRVINWPDDWCLKVEYKFTSTQSESDIFSWGACSQVQCWYDKIPQSEILNQYWIR